MKIQKGDLVVVIWVGHPEHTLKGYVEYTPCAIGDSWRIKRQSDNTTIYVNSFSYMKLIEN